MKIEKISNWLYALAATAYVAGILCMGESNHFGMYLATFVIVSVLGALTSIWMDIKEEGPAFTFSFFCYSIFFLVIDGFSVCSISLIVSSISTAVGWAIERNKSKRIRDKILNKAQ